jgi:hypothetical protein
MQEVVTEIIEREYVRILPEARKLCDVRIKAEKRFGFHIVTSPRFICTLNVKTHGDWPLGIKLFVKHRPNVDQEYKNMRLLWREHYFDNPNYHIPEPLYIDEEHALLFMRYWPGESFLRLFYKCAARGRQRRVSLVRDCVQSAASWLIDFQDIYSSGEEKQIPVEMLDFESQLMTATHLNVATRRRIIEKMLGLQKSLPKLRETYVHDQYLFRNIIYRNGEICVVDLPNVRIGWPLYDFFTFYTGVERLKQYPFISNATCKLAKDAFAYAYLSQKGIRYDAEELENLWAFFLVGYVERRYKYRQSRGIRGTLNDIFVRQMFSKLAKWSER